MTTHFMARLATAACITTLAAQAQEELVSVGSPPSPFSQNKQNEPAVAIDPSHPDFVVAGANDEIDMEACNAGSDDTCPFTQGVGVSGIYFSVDGGLTWTQPTYSGWTGRACLGVVGGTDPTCAPEVGPIGTLPGYYEMGLVSDGDPAVAFGPRPDASGKFSWANGSRLYYANLASKFGSTRDTDVFRGQEAVAVSRCDDLYGAALGDQSAWMPPVIAVPRQSTTTFSDKEQLWVDNAASSPYFGNAYVCLAQFRSNSRGLAAPVPLMFARSTDGGNTWSARQLTASSFFASPNGSTIRTDSQGTVYVFYLAIDITSGSAGQFMMRSYDGGQTFERPRLVVPVVAPGVPDPVLGRPVMDGIAGARADLAASPSIDIANGAPTGGDATDRIVLTWSDGRDGLNAEHAMLVSSTDGGNTWTAPANFEAPGDRPLYVAAALSPNGADLYLVYSAFRTPYRTDTSSPRELAGVMFHADISDGTIGPISEVHRGAPGDPRGTGQNNLMGEFLGDYVYAAASRTRGIGLWTDARNAADCPAIAAYRASLSANPSATPPAPTQDCPGTFGNSDIYGVVVNDPTP